MVDVHWGYDLDFDPWPVEWGGLQYGSSEAASSLGGTRLPKNIPLKHPGTENFKWPQKTIFKAANVGHMGLSSIRRYLKQWGGFLLVLLWKTAD